MSENKHNDFFVDSGKLSEAALNRKHSLENDPSSRTSIYDYLPTQEKIESDIMDKVISEMNEYDYNSYTDMDVRRALRKETCSVVSASKRNG